MASSASGVAVCRRTVSFEASHAISMGETIAVWAASAVVFFAAVSALTGFGQLVDNFGDNSAYISIAAAIRNWDFHGIVVKHFWGFSYAIAGISRLTGISYYSSLLLICWSASLASVVLAYELWGGWVATAFTIVNFDWYQRSFLGGSEPLFVTLIFGSFLAIRRERWALASLLAALATITRPLGIFLLIGIGLTLALRREMRQLVAACGIAIMIAGLYVIPLARYLHDPLATVHSYQSGQASATVPLFGIPFYAIIKGTILYPAPVTNLLLTFAWIGVVLAAIVAMLATEDFRNYSRAHAAEIIFAAPYLLSLYCYNYPMWARGNFPRFAIPIIPFVLVALWRWLPRSRWILWALAPVTALLAACSAIGINNVVHLLRARW